MHDHPFLLATIHSCATSFDRRNTLAMFKDKMGVETCT
ncbi:hypothetical protein BRPE64_CCDS02660 [Caballeronia insecticola]|uniref:Uncharacterized protein n=1 Tax=Caballeronia insecticola TaxID=758793 RepID=R4WP60_9BURK|nr:hypothetical protein BRPE64_CCDS02660 [Caballeronia insecticola]